MCPVSHDLLVLCVETRPENLQLLLRDPMARLEVEVDVVIQGSRYRQAQLEIHGGLARTHTKKSWRLNFDDSNGWPRVDYFGEGPEAHERLVLLASWVDPTYMRGKLTMDLTREAGGLAPRMGHAVLYLNGAYHGLYILAERVDEHFLARHGMSPEGNLYKAESHYANWALHEDPLSGFAKKNNRAGRSGDLGDFFSALNAAALTTRSYDSEVRPRLHITEWEAWNRVHTFAMNNDTFTKNYYLYHDPGAPPGSAKDRFRIIMWDADATWGNKWDGTPLSTDPRDWFGTPNHFAHRYFAVSGYATRYLQDYRAALGKSLHPEALSSRLAPTARSIRAEAHRDLNHWSRSVDYDAEIARLHGVFRERHQAMTRALERPAHTSR